MFDSRSTASLLTFIETSEATRLRERNAMAAAQDLQKENSDSPSRQNTHVFKMGVLVLRNAKNLPIHAVSAVGNMKLLPRSVGPFTVIGVHGNAYTLNLPSAMATHPTFYVGMLKACINPMDRSETDATVVPSDEGHPSRAQQTSHLGGDRSPLRDLQMGPKCTTTDLRGTQSGARKGQDPVLSSQGGAQESLPE